MKAYQTDLAYIHDVGFGGFARDAAPGVLHILQQQGIKSGLVVDLGCGSGIWAQALTRAGYDVVGVDISSAMLALAKQKAPKAKFQKASLLRVKLPECDAVTALGECLNYQFDKASRKALSSLFARVFAALRPGGAFIFDLLQPGVQRAANPQRICSEGKDWAILVEKEEDFAKRTLTRRMTMFRKVGKLYRRSTETHVVQLCKALDIAHALRDEGFRVQLIYGYGEMKFRPAHVGFIATKTD
ncbi:MAG TPA: class I SAM-dependent methyltransferase [Blastocatellia bacterium]|nr:class I SAM-dependent methyltransferase [Blastocatellia bacterium]